MIKNPTRLNCEFIEFVDRPAPILLLLPQYCGLQAQEDVSKNLLSIKNMLYGNSDNEPQTDIVVAQVAQEFYNNNLLYSLICNLNKIEFEVRTFVPIDDNQIVRRVSY